MHNLRLTNPNEPFGFDLFDQLLHAENEDEVEQVLKDYGLLTYEETDPNWKPLGDMKNNFGSIGNQQSDASAALVEKIINAIDAVLMAKCYEADIAPSSPAAPASMEQAVERFFDVPDGAIERRSATERTKLAENIYLIAVGSRERPSYLIVDRGEGQTPARFPATFLSLHQSNKIDIPFVQGKFNSGGTGVLQFCGEEDRNYQLIVSRRHPRCPAEGDATRDYWGYTIVRRLPPTATRRSSMFVYLATKDGVPMFPAPSIPVLTQSQPGNKPDKAYARELEYGTCVKLYNYDWRAKSRLTDDGRYELERLLHRSILPFRVSETRQYGERTHSYSTTVSGGWSRHVVAAESDGGPKVERGFPTWGALQLRDIGRLPYQVVVFTSAADQRRVPNGVVFVVNGQVHGAMPSDYISKKLGFDYLVGKNGPLSVSVDCTNMEPIKRENFLMASRDRLRRNSTYEALEAALTHALKSHDGLKDLNQRRWQQSIERHIKDAPIDAWQRILDLDPTLQRLFTRGEKLVTGTGPKNEPQHFEGKYWPTFFRLAHVPKGGLVKHCPANRTCRVDFVTDAVDDYFTRYENHGVLTTVPDGLIENQLLTSGRFAAHFHAPWDAMPGDQITVTITTTDLQTESKGSPFISQFTLVVDPPEDTPHPSGSAAKPRKPDTTNKAKRPTLDIPMVVPVTKDDWEKYDLDELRSIRIKHGAEGGYVFYVNVDSAYLLTEISHSKEKDRALVKYWFIYGLALAAEGMILHSGKQPKLTEDGNQFDPGSSMVTTENQVDLDDIAYYCNGVASMIVPIVRTLDKSAISAAVEATD